MGNPANPAGETITVNSQYLVRDGKPWLPVMGEFHFSRYPRAEWEEELDKMKAGGVDIVSTYIIWIHHEEVNGTWDWSDERDLREFVRLCQKHGLLVLLRIGPWAHAEVRNGGFPDWVQRMPNLRSNDPKYLAAVDEFYKQIAQQVRGQLWKDGGPIIGVQLENEYMLQGPGQGAAHILKLKQMAVADGFDVPLYTVTGWDGAVFPAHEVLPVFGGYADWPWSDAITNLPPNELYAFRFSSREGGDMGAPGGRPASAATTAALADYPFLTAEFGAGIEDTYHRRPVIRAEDIEAIVPTQIGSGVNMLGWYMYHGGRNPAGKLTTLQESQATHYANDVPEISYDFQAPIGQYGEERESYRRLRLAHYFLQEFGPELAPMTVRLPSRVPSGPEDFSIPRASLRSDGQRGFLFVNNYVRGYLTPQWQNFQAEIATARGMEQIPTTPITLPAGATFFWPVDVALGGVTLRYATAQLITTFERGDETYVFLAAQKGISPEIALASGSKISGPGISVENFGDIRAVRHLQTGTAIACTVSVSGGRMVHFVFLDEQQADRLSQVHIGGKKILLYTGAEVESDGAALSFRSSRGDFYFGVLGEDDSAWTTEAGVPWQAADPEGVFRVYHASYPGKSIDVKQHLLQAAGDAPAVERGNAAGWRKEPVAVAPTDAAFAKAAARYEISIPPDALAGDADVFLNIRYVGDVARLYSGAKLLDDNFFNGQPWLIGLKRFARMLDRPLRLEILPLRRDAPIYFDTGYRPQISAKQAAELTGVQATPEYEVRAFPKPQLKGKGHQVKK